MILEQFSSVKNEPMLTHKCTYKKVKVNLFTLGSVSMDDGRAQELNPHGIALSRDRPKTCR